MTAIGKGDCSSSGAIPGPVEPFGGVRVGDLSTLLARVEAAEGPDREIDLALACLAFNQPEEHFLKDELGRRAFGYQQPYTRSLDAALALCARLLPGWGWALSTSSVGPFAVMWLPGERIREGQAKTPALALIAAMLKALGQ